MISETCIAPVNIAVIKYWGKRDEELILPINSSLSMTLSTDQMCAKTTAAASATFKENRMWLNGEEVPFEGNPRMQKCLDALKRLAEAEKSKRFPLEWKLHICSENNFPTAAGLASSAAGYACLVYTLANLYGVEKSELSSIARQGSGSACRSIYGGFVEWVAGIKNDGSDSIAIQVQPALHWPEMRVLILVVNDSRKKTSSTNGMLNSVNTSDLIKHRANVCVPQRILQIKEAIARKDFETFGKITMRDSNQFHAICLDTYPPCVYMNDTSHAIVNFIHQYNESRGDVKVAYTFDAGPNACLYLLEEEVANVLSLLNKVFPSDNSENSEYVKGIPIDLQKARPASELYNREIVPVGNNLLKYIIHTKAGEGPQKLLDPEDSLVDDAGMPKKLK